MSISVPKALPGNSSPATALQPTGGYTPPAGQTAAAAQLPAAPPQPQPSSAKVDQAIENLKRAVEPVAKNLEFSVDKSTGMTVIKVVDSSTQQVVRQIPSEEVLALAKDLDKLQGLLLNKKA